MEDPATPLALLRAGADSYGPFLGADGELRDPVFGEPTQYGTPYHAFCRAVLALRRPDPSDLPAARDGLRTALRHLRNPGEPPRASSFQRADGTTGAGNHRDFFWPPVVRAHRILALLGDPETAERTAVVRAVDIEAAFAARPPSNWSAVWLSGEGLRRAAGLSPVADARFEAWLGTFFESGRILLDEGFYQEPGHPNSYDLFTRLHLADLLADGYGGPWREALEELLRAGLRRSLAVQLSDGSLAAAHRSSGQSWNDGAQCAYFATAAALLGASDPDLAGRAEDAAWRAFDSLGRWRRPDGPFSPVYNVLPPDWRVGYEAYTADAHYANLALAFLAAAIQRGLGDRPRPPAAPREAAAFVEADPTWRALVHSGPYSAHVNAFPAAHYDAFGLTEVTFGAGRRLHFGPTVRCLADAGFLNLGLATRRQAGRSPLRVLAREPLRPCAPIAAGPAPGAVRLSARCPGDVGLYEIAVAAGPAGVEVAERVHGHDGFSTLLVPYLLDAGDGRRTEVEVGGEAATWVHLRSGAERLRLEVDAPRAQVTHLRHGFENRRGLCGLLRLDLDGRRDGVRYRLVVEA